MHIFRIFKVKELMPKSKTTWFEELNESKKIFKVEKIADNIPKRCSTGSLAMLGAIEVDELMRKVPAGKSPQLTTSA